MILLFQLPHNFLKAYLHSAIVIWTILKPTFDFDTLPNPAEKIEGYHYIILEKAPKENTRKIIVTFGDDCPKNNSMDRSLLLEVLLKNIQTKSHPNPSTRIFSSRFLFLLRWTYHYRYVTPN